LDELVSFKLFLILGFLGSSFRSPTSFLPSTRVHYGMPAARIPRSFVVRPVNSPDRTETTVSIFLPLVLRSVKYICPQCRVVTEPRTGGTLRSLNSLMVYRHPITLTFPPVHPKPPSLTVAIDLNLLQPLLLKLFIT